MSSAPRVRAFDRTTPPHILTLVLLAGLAAMAMNIFLPALPEMTAYFDTDYAVMQLSVSLYLAFNAGLQIVIGPLSDKFGRRPVLLGSAAIFVLATIGTIYAPTAEWFLVFRMIQTVVVAGMVLSRAIVRDMVGPAEAASMIGYVTMGMALVPMVAPMLGGVISETFGWKATFWVMLVCGLGVWAMVWADLGETAPPDPDGFGAQLRQYPELLTSPRFWGYSAAAAFSSGAFFAYLGGAPFIATEVFGLSPTRMGIYFGAPAIGYAVGNYISGRFSVRVGINRMVMSGTLVSAFGPGLLLALTLAGAATAEIFFACFVFVGLGNGMVLPNANAGMLSVRPRLAGSAAGLGGAIMIGGGAALSALAGALLTPETGAMPLILLNIATSILSILAIALVVWRERQLRLAGQDLQSLD